MRSWQDARGWRRNTGGKLTGIYSTGSPLCSWTLPSLPLLDSFNHGLPCHQPWWMTHPEITLLGTDWQGAVLPGAVLLVCLWEGQPPTTVTPLMRKGYLLIPPPLRSHFVRGGVAGEIEVTGVVVTLMRLSPPEGGGRKMMGSLARSKSLNLGARRAILMMWLMPLGSGPIVSLITMNTMRIPTSGP